MNATSDRVAARAARAVDSEPAMRGKSAPARLGLFRYSPLLLLILIVIADGGQRADPDLWGHLRFGQAALASGRLAPVDSYSYTAAGASWRNHEWLTEVIMAFAYDHLGVVGLKIWKLLCVAATIIFLAAGLAETGAPPAYQFNILTIAAVALTPQMEFRPQLYTFAFFAAMLALLGRHLRRGRAPLWVTVPLMALWANLHGGFIIGCVTLAAYAGAVAIVDLRDSAGLGRGPRLGGLALAALAATLANPYGVGIWRTVLRALRNPATRRAVNDWHPLAFAIMEQWRANHAGVVYFLCAIGLIAATAIAFAMTPRAGDFPLAVIAAIMSVAAFVAVRNLPLAVIACAAPLAGHAASLVGRGGADDPARSGVNPWIAGAAALALAWYAGILSDRIPMDIPYPAGAVGFMRRHSLRGNILNDFGWGEYLIWHMEPGSKVFIDGRYDTVYSYALINQYLAFRFALPGAQKVIDGWPHDFVMIAPETPPFPLMNRDRAWKLIFLDGDAALFARANGSAAGVTPQIDPALEPKPGYFP